MKRLLVLLVVGFLGTVVLGQNGSSIVVEVVINTDHGWPTRILVSGTSHKETAWLGISLYPYGTIDSITEGRHSTITLSKGDFHHELKVDKPLLGGSFEFAIWGKKVDKVDCTEDYCYWCKANGYHLEDLVVYKSGLLNNMEGYK